MGDTDTKNAWVQRVLGVTVGGSNNGPERNVASSASASRSTEATPGKGRGVAYRKMLLRWREAQAAFSTNLKTLGTTVLARPEVQADPRIDAIRQAVDELPLLVPEFGGELEDVLDAGLSESDPAEQARLATEGMAAIDAYRQQLASSQLAALEQFAAKELGATLPMGSALDQALVELKQQLEAQR